MSTKVYGVKYSHLNTKTKKRDIGYLDDIIAVSSTQAKAIALHDSIISDLPELKILKVERM